MHRGGVLDGQASGWIRLEVVISSPANDTYYTTCVNKKTYHTYQIYEKNQNQASKIYVSIRKEEWTAKRIKLQRIP